MTRFLVQSQVRPMSKTCNQLFDTLYDQAASLFEKPVWLRPDSGEKIGLFD